MAYVEVTGTTQTSISVRLSGMDTTYPTNDRTCDWYIGGKYDGSTKLYAYASSGGTYTFRGLTAGTRYTIMAYVYTSSWTTTFTGNATTDAPQHYAPNITSFSVEQNYEGSHTAICTCRVSNLESGATYKIEVRSSSGVWWEKTSGNASTFFTEWIELDEYITYSVRLTITNYVGYVDTYTTTVTMKAKPFAWTYAKTSGGTFNLTADEWNGLWDAIENRLGHSYSHTRAYYGNTFTAEMYNQAIYAMGRWNTVSRGDTITAKLMNDLVTYVNSM